MTHMSGIGRDLPPGNARGHWPKTLFGGGPPTYNGLDFPSHQQVLHGVAKSRPVVAPYTYPAYSNTGYSLLGIANVAANRAASGPSEPSTHADLVQQDIFRPLRFNGTSFLTTDDNIHNVVVPSLNPWEIVRGFDSCLVRDPEPPSGPRFQGRTEPFWGTNELAFRPHQGYASVDKSSTTREYPVAVHGPRMDASHAHLVR